MSTFDQLSSAIIADLAAESEEGITAAVSNAIDLSIRHYETRPWWFLETQYSFNTADGTEYYDVPSDFGSTEVSLTITVSNNTYPLIKRDFKLLDDWFVAGTVFTGYPTDYAMYKQQMRMYPIPNGTYSCTLNYYKLLGAPTGTNSNSWTTEAEMLIRARSEWQLHSLRYHDVEAASVAKAAEVDALGDLQGQNSLRMVTGVTRKRRL